MENGDSDEFLNIGEGWIEGWIYYLLMLFLYFVLLLFGFWEWILYVWVCYFFWNLSSCIVCKGFGFVFYLIEEGVLI